MIKTFKEINDGLKEEEKKTVKLTRTLEALKTESKNNGGKNLELITTDLFRLYCWIEQLEITIATNQKLGKRTKYTATTPTTEIANSEYLPKL